MERSSSNERIGISEQTLSMLSIDEQKRMKVIFEIIETEQQYLKDLNITINEFKIPLQKKGLLTEREISSTFSNIVSLCGIHEEFCGNLSSSFREFASQLGEECHSPSPTENGSSSSLTTPSSSSKSSGSSSSPHRFFRIGKFFVQFAAYLKMYSIYCNNHDKARAFVKIKIANDKKFADYLGDQQKNPLCRGQTLQSFLIKPVQRLCKYPLFIRELLKSKAHDAEEKSSLESAYDSINNSVQSIEDSKKSIEEIEKIAAIQKELEGGEKLSLVAPSRHFLKDEEFLECEGPALFSAIQASSELRPQKLNSFSDDSNLLPTSRSSPNIQIASETPDYDSSPSSSPQISWRESPDVRQAPPLELSRSLLKRKRWLLFNDLMIRCKRKRGGNKKGEEPKKSKILHVVSMDDVLLHLLEGTVVSTRDREQKREDLYYGMWIRCHFRDFFLFSKSVDTRDTWCASVHKMSEDARLISAKRGGSISQPFILTQGLTITPAASASASSAGSLHINRLDENDSEVKKVSLPNLPKEFMRLPKPLKRMASVNTLVSDDSKLSRGQLKRVISSGKYLKKEENDDKFWSALDRSDTSTNQSKTKLALDAVMDPLNRRKSFGKQFDSMMNKGSRTERLDRDRDQASAKKHINPLHGAQLKHDSSEEPEARTARGIGDSLLPSSSFTSGVSKLGGRSKSPLKGLGGDDSTKRRKKQKRHLLGKDDF